MKVEGGPYEVCSCFIVFSLRSTGHQVRTIDVILHAGLSKAN